MKDCTVEDAGEIIKFQYPSKRVVLPDEVRMTPELTLLEEILDGFNTPVSG